MLRSCLGILHNHNARNLTSLRRGQDIFLLINVLEGEPLQLMSERYPVETDEYPLYQWTYKKHRDNAANDGRAAKVPHQVGVNNHSRRGQVHNISEPSAE